MKEDLLLVSLLMISLHVYSGGVTLSLGVCSHSCLQCEPTQERGD
jgi:hypothetical protein